MAAEEETPPSPMLFDDECDSVIFVEEVITVDELEGFLDEEPKNLKTWEYEEYLRLKAKYEHPAMKKRTRSEFHSC